jgi:hypothetical protein
MKNILLDQKRWFFYLALILIALAGSYALLRSTPYGLGLINDTAAYVDGSNNLLKGLGYVRTSGEGGYKPITNYPPVFSFLLLPLTFLGLDIFQSGRGLITILFGLDVVLVGLLIYRISHSVVFSLMGALLLAYSDVYLEVYAYLLSEPLFITFLLLAFYLLSVYFEVRRRRWLILTGLVLDIACLTRYVGFSVVASIALAVLLLETNWRYIFTGQSTGVNKHISLSRQRFFSKEASLPIKDLALFLFSSLVFILIWMVYTFFVDGSLGNRSFVWHPIDLSSLFEAMKYNFDWLSPKRLVLAIPLIDSIMHALSLLLIPGLLFGLCWEIWRRYRTEPEQLTGKVETATAFSLSLHMLIYILFLVISISVFDASTPLNSRILSVAIIPLIVLFFSGLAWVWQVTARLNGWVNLTARIAVGLFCIGLVYSGLKDGSNAINNLSQDGLGFAQRSLTGSKLIQYIHDLPPISIYSNKPTIILLLAGKASKITPTPVDPVNNQAHLEFLNEVETIHNEVQDGRAILVIVNMGEKSDPATYSLFLTLTKGLSRQYRDGDIRIFAQAK